MNTDQQQTAARLHRGARAAKNTVDVLLDSLNDLGDQALKAVDDSFVLELMSAQGHLEQAAMAALVPLSARQRISILQVAEV